MACFLLRLLSIGASVLGLSATSHAMGWTNCHNSKLEVVRTEQEIWGANQIEWKLRGKLLQQPKEYFDVASKKLLNRSLVNDASFGTGIKELYTIDVVVKEKDQIAVDCRVECSAYDYSHLVD